MLPIYSDCKGKFSRLPLTNFNEILNEILVICLERDDSEVKISGNDEIGEQIYVVVLLEFIEGVREEEFTSLASCSATQSDS